MKSEKWCKKRLKKVKKNSKVNQKARHGKLPMYWFGYWDALSDVLEEEADASHNIAPQPNSKEGRY